MRAPSRASKAKAGAKSESCAHGDGGRGGPRRHRRSPRDAQHDELGPEGAHDIGGERLSRARLDQEVEDLGKVCYHGLRRSR